MPTRTLQNFEVYVTRFHDDFTVFEDSAYCTLAEYTADLQKSGGIYDTENQGWVPYHRINYIKRVTK